MKYPRTLPGELSYHHPSHCPADHPGGLNPDSRHQFHTPWCISYVTLENSRELKLVALITFFLYKKSLFLRLPFLALLYFGPYYCLSLFPTGFSGFTIYWLSFIDQFSPERKKRKNQREEYHKATCTLYQEDLDHTSLSTTPFTFQYFPFLYPLRPLQ